MKNQNPSKIIIQTPNKVVKNTFFYVQDTGVNNGEPFSQAYGFESFLFVAVTRGRGELAYNNKIYRLSEGDCFLIDNHIPHRSRSIGNDFCQNMWVRFGGATSAQYYSYFIERSENVFRPLCFANVKAVIDAIIYMSEHKVPHYEILTSNLIVELLTIALTTEAETVSIDSALRQKLMDVHDYIEIYFSTNISLKQLSEDFYISKYYLAREYKKLFGKTIFQHIMMCRINYGKKLLRFSDRPIEEIALMCGFNDPCYFARQFKRSENLTCLEYRKLLHG